VHVCIFLFFCEDLRVGTYEEVYEKMTIAAKRYAEKEPTEYMNIKTTVQNILFSLSDDKQKEKSLIQLAIDQNFNTAWLKKPAKEKGEKRKTLAEQIMEASGSKMPRTEEEEPRNDPSALASRLFPETTEVVDAGAKPALPAAPDLPHNPEASERTAFLVPLLDMERPPVAATPKSSTPPPFLIARQHFLNQRALRPADQASEVATEQADPIPSGTGAAAQRTPQENRDPNLEAETDICRVCMKKEPNLGSGEGRPEHTECQCPRCGVCFQLLEGDAETVTLPCYHTQHKTCLDRYMQVTGKPLEFCCAFKCNSRASAEEIDDALLSLTTSASQPVHTCFSFCLPRVSIVDTHTHQWIKT
jgi:hypothetical protein